MPARKVTAIWRGTLKEGNGTLKLGSGYEGPYTYLSRFEDGAGTNPEEMLGAAHAGCFTMALGSRLGREGFTVNTITTDAQIYLEKVGEALAITRIVLNVVGSVDGVDAAAFANYAEDAKKTCIISRALSPDIQLEVTTSLA
ncbi:MAG: OsmC family peroxiredoxin [Anaerolineae bacterium]|nr:OsmC family peroxiredoxin [Anaerolineae bacterium]